MAPRVTLPATLRGECRWDAMPGAWAHCLSPSHSRNQLSSLPPYICQLPLRVLIVSNNKLGALPPDISALGSLRQLVRMGAGREEGLSSQALGTFPGASGEGSLLPGKAFSFKSLVSGLSSRRITHCHIFVRLSLILSSYWHLLANRFSHLVLGSSYLSTLTCAESSMFPLYLITLPWGSLQDLLFRSADLLLGTSLLRFFIIWNYT